MKFLDPDHPFFAKLWVRVATVAAPIAWGLFEVFWIGSAVWGGLFIAVGVYAGWIFYGARKGG